MDTGPNEEEGGSVGGGGIGGGNDSGRTPSPDNEIHNHTTNVGHLGGINSLDNNTNQIQINDVSIQTSLQTLSSYPATTAYGSTVTTNITPSVYSFVDNRTLTEKAQSLSNNIYKATNNVIGGIIVGTPEALLESGNFIASTADLFLIENPKAFYKMNFGDGTKSNSEILRDAVNNSYNDRTSQEVANLGKNITKGLDDYAENFISEYDRNNLGAVISKDYYAGILPATSALKILQTAKKIDKIGDVYKIKLVKFDDLAKFRDDLGLPIARSTSDKSTLALIEVNGKKIYGINAHGQRVTGVNAISSTHAEIDVLNQIKQRAIDVRGQNLTLYVDRKPCKACDQNGGIRSMVEQLGLKQLTIISPNASIIIKPK